MVDDEIGPGDLAAESADGRKDLFVDAVFPAQRRMVAKQADVNDDRRPIGTVLGKAQTLHGEAHRRAIV